MLDVNIWSCSLMFFSGVGFVLWIISHKLSPDACAWTELHWHNLNLPHKDASRSVQEEGQHITYVQLCQTDFGIQGCLICKNQTRTTAPNLNIRWTWRRIVRHWFGQHLDLVELWTLTTSTIIPIQTKPRHITTSRQICPRNPQGFNIKTQDDMLNINIKPQVTYCWPRHSVRAQVAQ